MCVLKPDPKVGVGEGELSHNRLSHTDGSRVLAEEVPSQDNDSAVLSCSLSAARG